MNRFVVTTLGCKVNQCESEAIEAKLKKSGMVPAGNEKVSLCIVNTCAVTQKAAMQSRQAIRQAIRSHPEARIIVTGCYAQTEPEKIRTIEGVHDIIGHMDKPRIPEMVIASKAESTGPAAPLPSGDFQSQNSWEQHPSPSREHRTRPFVKIQDGCNAYCTYCIVPRARGRSRSLPPAAVMDEITELKRSGYREVVLTGIHLGHYGQDLSPKTSLFDLLRRILASSAIQRVRLSSIEPAELSEEIIRLAKHSPHLCRHFHVPLQSGDDRILTRMQRPYTSDFFRDLILKIHHLVPDAAIGVDTLIGFPGETRDAFNNTYALIQSLPLAYLHVFPFSPRKGTPAASYPDPVPVHTIQQRCRDMRALGSIKKREFYTKFIGTTAEVLIENREDRSTGLLTGMTSNYLRVLIHGGAHLKNTLVRARCTELTRKPEILGELC